MKTIVYEFQHFEFVKALAFAGRMRAFGFTVSDPAPTVDRGFEVRVDVVDDKSFPEYVEDVVYCDDESPGRDRKLAGDDLVRKAREVYGSKNIEIDDDAAASVADAGTWVQAWVWVETSD